MRYIKWLYLLGTIFCVLFNYASDGLTYFEAGELKYTRELFSSGSDDDVAIYLIGIISLIASVISFFVTSPKYLSLVVIIVAALQLLSLILIEVGSILITIFYNWDFYLLGATLSYFTIISIVIYNQAKSERIN